MFNRRFDQRHVLGALVGVTVLALVLRFYALGWRVFHWDEARVGYWTLRYMETGVWNYRGIVHGPVLFHVNKFLFGLFGTGDAIARSFVAIVGGLLPLSAWLFRSRLPDLEVVLVGLILALDPVLLYYGRFMRNDVLVAGFSFVMVGFIIRFLDTRRDRYLYAGVLALGLAFGTKEIALVYLAIWAGALLLLFDRRIFLAREKGQSWRQTAFPLIRQVYRGLRKYRSVLLLAGVEFLVIIVLLYAPRPDLYQAFGNLTRMPGVIEAATIESAEELFGLWISGGHEHSYVAYLLDAVETTAYVSLPVTIFAVLGFLTDRYTGQSPRDIVAFSFYWGAVVFFIYPAITDISAPWSLVHALVPLSIPAAVGFRTFFDLGIDAWEDNDRVAVAIVGLVVVVLLSQVSITAFQTSYQSPQADDNFLVQYGQPGSHMQDVLAEIERIARTTEGTDVVFYGEHFAMTNESSAQRSPAGSNWHNRLPIAWYLERSNATTASATALSELPSDPPVVIARTDHYSELRSELTGYDARTYEITSFGTETVIFIDTDRRTE